jgi:hypothetical protein
MRRGTASGHDRPQAVAAGRYRTSGGGQPLAAATRAFFEEQFEYDFGHVRIHTGEKADQAAQEAHALAYTTGANIVFGKDQYRPDTTTGKKLIAHELTHVIQQAAHGAPVIQRACRDESFYRSSSDYCRDDTFSPSTHPGKTCYRQIPARSSYFSCPPGEHVCFDADGNCEDSPDRSSLAEGKESDGSCNWNTFCVAEHTAVDFVPAVADAAVEPFREIGRELSKALDPMNWYRLAGYPF